MPVHGTRTSQDDAGWSSLRCRTVGIVRPPPIDVTLRTLYSVEWLWNIMHDDHKHFEMGQGSFLTGTG